MFFNLFILGNKDIALRNIIFEINSKNKEVYFKNIDFEYSFFKKNNPFESSNLIQKFYNYLQQLKKSSEEFIDDNIKNFFYEKKSLNLKQNLFNFLFFDNLQIDQRMKGKSKIILFRKSPFDKNIVNFFKKFMSQFSDYQIIDLIDQMIYDLEKVQDKIQNKTLESELEKNTQNLKNEIQKYKIKRKNFYIKLKKKI
jgi:hypothetical protein